VEKYSKSKEEKKCKLKKCSKFKKRKKNVSWKNIQSSKEEKIEIKFSKVWRKKKWKNIRTKSTYCVERTNEKRQVRSSCMKSCAQPSNLGSHLLPSIIQCYHNKHPFNILMPMLPWHAKKSHNQKHDPGNGCLWFLECGNHKHPFLGSCFWLCDFLACHGRCVMDSYLLILKFSHPLTQSLFRTWGFMQ